MNKIKYIFLSILIVTSFYFTDKIMIYIENKNPIMQEIISKEKKYNILPVNAEIKNNTIIPGVNGKNINKHKSLLKMNDFGSFNELYLVYDNIKPEINLEKNKDKIIIKGNNNKHAISLILEESEDLENYLNQNKIKYDILTTKNTNLKLNREYLNGSKEDFSDINSLLNKNNLNKKICLINYLNKETCINKKYYLVQESLKITNSNIVESLNKINSGEIILIPKSLTLINLKLVINEIKKQDLSIIYLSKLINENI